VTAVEIRDELLSAEEYIAGELKSEIRHEYLAGRVYAMAGASVIHNTTAANFHGELWSRLRGKPSQAFIADMKVHLQDRGDEWFYYPDVMVNCDPAGLKQYYCDTPSLIVEVLSPDTQRTDRREKWFAYQRLPSLHTYILVDQEKRELTVYRRVGSEW